MPISITCPNCEARFRLPDALAGKDARCQRCGQRFNVPAEAPTTVAMPPKAGSGEGPHGDDVVSAILVDPSLVDSDCGARGSPPALGAETAESEPQERKRSKHRRRDAKDAPAFPIVLVLGVSLSAVLVAALGLFAVGAMLANADVPMRAAAVDVHAAPPPILRPPQPIPQPRIPVPVKPPVPAPDDALDGQVALEGSLQATDPPSAQGMQCRSFSLETEKGGAYVIDLRSAAFDPHLFLFDETGKLVAENDDFQGLNSRIRFASPNAGIYRIDAATHSGGVGPFHLIVRRERGPAPKVAARPAPELRPPTGVEFDAAGEYRTSSELTDADPFLRNRGPHHRYSIALEAGKSYSIELSSRAFSPSLALADETGGRLAESQHTGESGVARIVYRASKAGTALLLASPAFRGQGSYALSIRRDGSPVALRNLAAIDLPESGAPKSAENVARLKLPGDAKGRIFGDSKSKFVSSLHWSDDGKALFALTADGVLSRFAMDEPVMEQQLNIGRRCGNMERTSDGLLISVLDLEEVWLVRSETLALIRRIPVPELRSVAATREGSTPLAAYGPAKQPHLGGLITLDAKEGRPLKRFDAPHRGVVAVGEHHAVALGERFQFVRLRISGPDVAIEEEGVAVAHGESNADLCASRDGKYVALPTPGGNLQSISGHPSSPTPSTYVYHVGSLRKPVFVLRSGASPKAVGFDPVGQLAFTQNSEAQLLVYSFGGEFVLGFPVASRGEVPLEFAPHPSGKRVAIRFERRIADVTLPSLP